MINNLSKNCCIPRSGPGALPHLKVRRIFSKWGFYLAPRCAALSIYTASPCVTECRGADGELKLASFCSSGIRCSAPGRLGFVQLQPLNGLLSGSEGF